jgi:predicted dehydrogenase
VDAGVHTFFEKPVAVDAPGVRRVLATIQKAKETNVALLGGLGWRYETHMIDMIKRLHDGAVGEMISLDATRHSGYARPLPRREEWSETEWILRNWYNVNWLGGDFFVEQFVHDLDMLCWAKQAYPQSCIATGGRISRTREIDGNVYDHFAATFTFADGSRMHATTRQQPGTKVEYNNLVFGTKGVADLMKYQITGENRFRNRARRTQLHQLEHDAFFAALRAGDTPNDVEYMAESTLVGLLGREAAYTGQEISWEKMLNSTKQYGPDSVDSLDQPLEIGPVPIPGVTPFV